MPTDIVQKFTKRLMVLCYSCGILVWVLSMLVRNASSSIDCVRLEELEYRMAELIALRRAVCLLNARLGNPKGPRRRLQTRAVRFLRWPELGGACQRRVSWPRAGRDRK